MSPLMLRRYRAERLLRREFAGMKGRVIRVVVGRLRGCGVSLDEGDLEACYAMAWQGLYMEMLEGQEIANPVGWLVLVTFRRAIEESRSRARLHPGTRDSGSAVSDSEWDAGSLSAPQHERDLAAELDDRVRLRHLFEGLRVRLSEREREAAVLCYLQGLPRAEAAVRMEVSEARMRKLMDGVGASRPGVASKVGALVQSIRDGEWCEEQGSLMRGLAFGILDPGGERYRLALAHRGECPACRAYVVSLRGLAAALPPTLLPWGLGGGVLARLGESAHAGATHAGATSAGATATAGGVGASAGAPLGGGVGGVGGVGTAGGAVGAGGAAGGGWLLAGGGLSAKLAVGCLLAVGVGAGCAALDGGALATHSPAHHHRALAHAASVSAHASPSGVALVALAGTTSNGSATTAAAGAALAPAARATREFGLEQPAPKGGARSAPSAPARSSQLAHAASSGAGLTAVQAESARSVGGPSAPVSTSSSVGSVASTQAAREFSPG
jgi:DNA-directed RNA polymerase specialized sigma24 family protein